MRQKIKTEKAFEKCGLLIGRELEMNHGGRSATHIFEENQIISRYN